MVKSIYKITNKINGKIYIGQSNNPERRFQEHINKSKRLTREGIIPDNSPLYSAMSKYGEDNFTYEIIESDIENYNDRERYWIQYYHSNNKKYGYNIQEGGEEPPHKYGEEHHLCTHSKETIDIIRNLLRNTTMTYADIARMTNYDDSSIARINDGILWYDDNQEYPIRKKSLSELKQERSEKIFNDLLNTKLSQKEIAKKYGVARSTVTAINRGQNYKKEGYDYPLRKNHYNKL